MTTSEASKIAAFTDGHYIALGKMVVEFQQLELEISFGLARLMSPGNWDSSFEFALTIINEHSFANKLKLLSNFIETHPISHFVPSDSAYLDVATKNYNQ